MVFSVRESNIEPGQQKRKKLAWKFFVEFMLAGDSTNSSYREKLYESSLGYNGLENFMKNFWETWALSKGMNNSKSAEREIDAI
jgi:hypothetical protein